MVKVHWFRHSHEDRNNWLRFGLMELSSKKKIEYQEWDLKEMLKYGFSQEIIAYSDLRHKSFILIEDGSKRTKCLVDNEDSFALFSELIVHVDIYFCAGYNSDIFIKKKLPKFYSWQTEEDLKWYKNIILAKINKFHGQFHKIKKFIPIAPNLNKEIKWSFFEKLASKADDKLRKTFGLSNNYSLTHKIYKQRFEDLMRLRNENLSYDITLSDTLWGWPMHRIKLHNFLKKIAEKGFNINTELNFEAPTHYDNGSSLDLKEYDFPIKNGKIQDYERMLASSKLGVFACGFHWGWRSIFSLALFLGIPTVNDKLLTEPYFDINNFKLHETEDEDWTFIMDLIRSIDEKEWLETKKHNQCTYDKYLHPEVIAYYLLNQTLN